MFCPKCGNELPDTAAFCNACGATIEKKDPVASTAAKPVTGDVAKKAGLSINPLVIGIVAAVVVLVIVFAAVAGSCSSKNDGGSASSTTTPSASAASGAKTSSAASTTTADSSDKYVGTWRDYDYGDTMEINSNGLCTINQKGVGTTYWKWEATSDGIRIDDNSHAYTLTYGYVNGKETLYNNSKGLKFQR